MKRPVRISRSAIRLKGENTITPKAPADGKTEIAVKGNVVIEKTDSDTNDRLVIEQSYNSTGGITAFSGNVKVNGGTVSVDIENAGNNTKQLTSLTGFSSGKFYVYNSANLDVDISSAYAKGAYQLYAYTSGTIDIDVSKGPDTDATAVTYLDIGGSGDITLTGDTAGHAIGSKFSIDNNATSTVYLTGQIRTYDINNTMAYTDNYKILSPADIVLHYRWVTSDYATYLTDTSGNHITAATLKAIAPSEAEDVAVTDCALWDIPEGQVGKAISLVNIIGAVKPGTGNGSYTFKVTEGSLPKGISIVNNNALYGTPTEYTPAGSCTITCTSNSKTASFVINYGEIAPTVAVTGITLDETELTIDKSGVGTALTATVLPADASVTGVTWSSSDENVVRIGNDGVVTGVAPGTATVTATTVQGAKSADCIVYVRESKPEAYVLEGKLCNLTANGTYKVNETDIVAGSDGKYAMPDAWFGTTLNVVKTGSVEKCNSVAQELETPYLITITAGANMSVDGSAVSYVSQGKNLTAVHFDADDGYYFPEDYSATAGSGVTVTRTDVGRIVVSGTPTANVSIVLPAASAISKLPTPTATFTATGASTGTLTGVEDGMKYRIDTGEWRNIYSSSVSLYDLGACVIDVVRKGDGKTNYDSDPQQIIVTKQAAPSVSKANVSLSGENDGRITGVTTAMEYHKEGYSWSDCTGSTVENLAPGTYYVRYKASGTALAGEEQEIVINADSSVTFKSSTHSDVDDVYEYAVNVENHSGSSSVCFLAAYDYRGRMVNVTSAEISDGANGVLTVSSAEIFSTVRVFTIDPGMETPKAAVWENIVM